MVCMSSSWILRDHTGQSFVLKTLTYEKQRWASGQLLTDGPRTRNPCASSLWRPDDALTDKSFPDTQNNTLSFEHTLSWSRDWDTYGHLLRCWVSRRYPSVKNETHFSAQDHNALTKLQGILYMLNQCKQVPGCSMERCCLSYHMVSLTEGEN